MGSTDHGDPATPRLTFLGVQPPLNPPAVATTPEAAAAALQHSMETIWRRIQWDHMEASWKRRLAATRLRFHWRSIDSSGDQHGHDFRHSRRHSQPEHQQPNPPLPHVQSLRMPRLFAAVWPPEEVKQALAESLSPRPVAEGVRWSAPDRYHITLRFLGEADEARAAEALAAVSSGSVSVALGPTVRRLGRNALVVPAHGLDELASAVATATDRIGGQQTERPYVGHLTVARVGRKRLTAYRPHAAAEFTASEFTLTRVEPAGAYSTVKRFSLEDGIMLNGAEP